MKKFIAIIIFLLICPLSTLAEEKSNIIDDSIIKKCEDLKASVNIANDMFVYGVKKKLTAGIYGAISSVFKP